MKDGTVFIASDFADIADTNTVRSALYRLVKDNILRRIINGIYEKPKYQEDQTSTQSSEYSDSYLSSSYDNSSLSSDSVIYVKPPTIVDMDS